MYQKKIGHEKNEDFKMIMILDAYLIRSDVVHNLCFTNHLTVISELICACGGVIKMLMIHLTVINEIIYT